MTQDKTLLVPVDFSDGSGRATEFAVELATALDAEVLLVAVFDLPMYAASMGVVPGGTAIAAINDVMDRVRAGTEQELQKLADELSKGDAKVRYRMAEGVPAHAICSLAEDEGVAMIVMGTHGRSGLERLMLGSVAAKVLRTAPCPVITVPLGKDD